MRYTIFIDEREPIHMLTRKTLATNGLLLLIAAIWGFAFSAQRSGMKHIGPFAFNAARFALGTLCLIPFLFMKKAGRETGSRKDTSLPLAKRLLAGAVVGTVLFIASSLQQVGLVFTTAGNAGFITSLYVVIVPLLGFFVKKKASALVWIGAAIAVSGLYVLSIGEGFTMAPGDILELAGAFFWALHILIVGHFADKVRGIELAIVQFAVCAALCLVGAIAFEPMPFSGLAPALVPVLYGGVLSIGVAYTLQIYAQKTAHPARASILLSMEALFAGVGGVIILGEPMTSRLLLGGGLMLGGAIVAQLEPPADSSPPANLATGSKAEG